VPAFRTIGVAGFYLAVLVTFAAGFATGRSPVILAVVSVACGLSFFAWALARRAVVGRESLSLFEHVWFALLCAAGVIALFGEPVLGYLDPVALGLCAFLAVGRIGCLVVGCCHGQPSEVGIRYGPELVEDGFPSWLVGVRLFPVQLVESIGIAAIGMVGVAMLVAATPGTTFLWFLAGYAVLRFGMEGIRGDERRVIAGLSLPRWMAVMQGGAALAIADPARFGGPAGIALLATSLLLPASAAVWRIRSPGRATVDTATLADARQFVESTLADRPVERPRSRVLPSGLSLAVSWPAGSSLGHVSFAMPRGSTDVHLLAAVAAAAAPSAIVDTATLVSDNVLHLLISPASVDPVAAQDAADAQAIYATALRNLDHGAVDVAREPVAPKSIGRKAYFRSGIDAGPRAEAFSEVGPADGARGPAISG
jgi:hypothetical protein